MVVQRGVAAVALQLSECLNCGYQISAIARQEMSGNTMSSTLAGPRIGLCIALAMGMNLDTVAIAAGPSQMETVVLVRHGEKPVLGLGQLNCQGLNRALALPAVIRKEFGKPDAIFAPSPAETKNDNGRPYNYVRPLATIEPTAIAFELPVDSSIGVSDIEALAKKLQEPAYRNAFVLVAWEHNLIVRLAQHLMADDGGDPNVVPDWKSSDFDSIYVLRITRTDKGSTARFDHRYENLNGASSTCPGQVPG
jgi:hypothetical protein